MKMKSKTISLQPVRSGADKISYRLSFGKSDFEFIGADISLGKVRKIYDEENKRIYIEAIKE